MNARQIPRNSRDHMGKVVVDNDFIIFRPQNQYRINASVTLIRSDNPVILESGPSSNPPGSLIERFLKHLNISSEDVKFLFISHGHQDHFSGLRVRQKSFPNAKTICHEAEIDTIRYPFLTQAAWQNALYFKTASKARVKVYDYYYFLLSHLYFREFQIVNRIDGFVKADTRVRLGDDSLHILHTPGHSKGHLCFLDNHKNLYLCDLVPFTPWCEPLPGALDDMIHSVEKLLRYSSNQVKRTVRAHGDIRRPPKQWEISEWGLEKERFHFFLDTINETLDMIPEKIKGKQVNLFS